jgi:hypothetical protein
LLKSLKLIIKFLIHRLFILLHIRDYINTNYDYKIFQSNKLHTFFGYYDKTPFSKDGEILLAIVSDKKKGPIKEPCVAHIGYFNDSDPTKFMPVGETTTWCWQLGARLMWYGEENNLIIYNKQIDNGYGSLVQRIDDKKIINELNYPIYDIDKNSEFGLTLNFSRLGRLRPGYGYINFSDSTVGQAYPPDDGIWICDLKRNTKELIIDLESVVNFEFDNNTLDTEHYINHLSFNPSGNRFLFFHVWNNNGKRRTRAITSDVHGNNLFQLNEGRTVSHYTWANDNELLMTGYGRSGFGYYLFRDLSNQIKPVGNEILKSDGHPSFLNVERIITDTYPESLFNEQKLLKYNLNGELNLIAQIHSSFFNQGEYKCDLHPRCNADYSKVAVDFCSQDGRKIAVFTI